MRRALWLSLLTLAGCAPAPTQLVVVVDTDIPIPSQLDEVIVQVTGPSGAVERESARLSDRGPLPLTVGVAPSGDALGPIEVIAMGRHASSVVVTRTHRVTLVRGESRTLVMHLTAACVGTSCPTGQTCAGQACGPIEIDPDDLPAWDGTPPGLRADAGPPRDGSVGDGGVPDASSTCGSGADCDDDNECTDDACTPTGCTHTPNTAGCDDGRFCNGLDRCVDGTCTGAGDPCIGSTTCDESSDVCTGCTVDADCPPNMAGVWGSCDFAGSACGETGTQSRAVVTFTCEAGSCVPHPSTESQACTRDTDGTICAGYTCGDWGGCGGFSDACDTSGTMTRPCSQGVCTSGACTTLPSSESADCSRSTDGDVCDPGGCGGWSACSFGDPCTTSGTQSRTCSDPATCSGGTCNGSGSRDETQGCSRGSTDGTPCGDPSCGAWGACVGNDTDCDPAGTQSRTCTPAVCSGGGCALAGTPYTETQACSRSVTGLRCDDYDDCTRLDRCTGDWSCIGTWCSSCCGFIP